MISFEGAPSWFRSDKRDLEQWLRKCAGEYGSRIQSLNYSFKNDEEITEANRDFLNHDYPTDIITFGYKEGKVVAGDILVGDETVASNAERYGSTKHDELCRVLAHGLLHLIGFDDKTDADKEKMRAAEENCLILRPKNLRYNGLV